MYLDSNAIQRYSVSICNQMNLVWKPTGEFVSSSLLSSFVRHINDTYGARIIIGDQDALHSWSIAHPRAFWLSVATFLNFQLRPAPTVETVLTHRATASDIPALVDVCWFHSSFTNVAEVLLRHASVSPNTPAIIYRPESATDDSLQRKVLSFDALRLEVMHTAAALRKSGVRKGDAVSAVLPNVPDTVVIMLAVAAVGAVWSCCSPDFGADAIVARLVQIEPSVIFYSPTYRFKHRVFSVHEKMRAIVSHLSSINLIVAVSADGDVQSPSGCSCQHVLFRTFLNSCREPDLNEFVFTPITMSDPFVTMFTSGTTGAPKCIVQGAGVVLNQMKEHSLHLEMRPSSIVFFNTSTSWMLHNWLVTVLATGASIILYDGAPFPPDDPLRLIRIAKHERVSHFGVGAAYLRSLQAALCEMPDIDAQLGKETQVEIVLATGSPSTEDHFKFACDFFPNGVQYVSMSGGTDINGCFALGSPWKPVRIPELSCAGLGMDVVVYDETGTSIVGKSGELVCRNPCPCMPLYFGNDPQHVNYRSAYFERFGERIWSHGDFAVATPTGGFIITGRSDSTLNPGGVRMGTSDIYAAVEGIGFVADTLVTEFAIKNDDVKVIMFVVTVKDWDLTEERKNTIRSEIRNKLSPRHIPYSILQVADIPYTFSGKKCEIPVKNLLNKRKVVNKEGVKNPGAFNSILSAFERAGLSRGFRQNCKL